MANMGKAPPPVAPKEPDSSDYPTETEYGTTMGPSTTNVNPSRATLLPSESSVFPSSDSSVLPSDYYYDPNETDYPYDPSGTDYADSFYYPSEYYDPDAEYPMEYTNPRPIRDPKTGHRHHQIKVTSGTDLAAMNIDEKKVNILPYYPATSTSQTGLIQSIGKPFNPNHAKNLPAPGQEFMINRRVSQVRLGQIQLLGKINLGLLESLVRVIKICAILIGVSGILLFGFVLYTMVAPTPFEYFHVFLDNNPWWKLSYIVAVIQPIVVAPYCRYALVNLKHLRMYYLRVPLTFLFPASLSICSSFQVTTAFNKPDAPESLDSVMKTLMAKYYDTYGFLAKFSWDSIHKFFKCCGYDGPEDWKNIKPISHFPDKSNSPGPAPLPQSCCKGDVDPCTIGLDEVKKNGCKDSYKSFFTAVAFAYLIMPLIIIAIEVVSVICMKMLHAVVRKELYDERKGLTVMCGGICSMCTIEDTDEELEYDEEKQKEPEEEETEKPKKSDIGKGDKAKEPDESEPEMQMPPAGRGRGRGRGRGKPPPGKLLPTGLQATNKVSPVP